MFKQSSISFKAMATEFSFQVYYPAMDEKSSKAEPEDSEIAEKAALEIDRLVSELLDEEMQQVRRLEDELSEFRDCSDVYRINQAKCGEKIAVRQAFCELFAKSLQIRAKTNVAFDPFAKSGSPILPHHFEFSADGKFFIKKSEHLKLTFGAIGKGYALDCVSTSLRNGGIYYYELSAGGSSLVRSGMDHIRRDEKFFWATGKSADDLLEGIELSTKPKPGVLAFGISGTYEKGQHILPSKTRGEVEDSSFRTVMIASHSAAEADALSTAFFIDGWKHSSAWKLSGNGDQFAVLTLDHQLVPAWNHSMNHYFDLAPFAEAGVSHE